MGKKYFDVAITDLHIDEFDIRRRKL